MGALTEEPEGRVRNAKCSAGAENLETNGARILKEGCKIGMKSVEKRGKR